MSSLYFFSIKLYYVPKRFELKKKKVTPLIFKIDLCKRFALLGLTYF